MMKKYIFQTFLVIFGAFVAQAQEPVLSAPNERAPQFPGGHAAYERYITDNLKYPKTALENNLQGRVAVSFVIDKEGAVQQVQVTKGVHPSLDAEAVRLLQSMPRWTPGEKDGQPVSVRFNTYLNFSLTRNPDAEKGLPGGMFLSVGMLLPLHGSEDYMRQGGFLDANFHGSFIKKGWLRHGMLEFGSRFGFTAVANTFQRRYEWEKGKKIFMLEPFFGNRWRLIGNPNASIWMGTGLKCHIFDRARLAEDEPDSPWLVSLRPYVSTTARIKYHVRDKGGFRSWDYLGVVAEWNPFWGKAPFAGSLFAVGVGWGFRQDVAGR